jgi:hypothetical protein
LRKRGANVARDARGIARRQVNRDPKAFQLADDSPARGVLFN